MFDISDKQQSILNNSGYQLITGGPGSGKTTISILKAVREVGNGLLTQQRVLFLSFSRAAVARMIEAAKENLSNANDLNQLEFETYHAFFWRILKTHSYLAGLPRNIRILTPPEEAIFLSSIRNKYGRERSLTSFEKSEKKEQEHKALLQIATFEGRISFSLFAYYAFTILSHSAKVRRLVSIAYPYIILDEFQDTNLEQWKVIKEAGILSTLLALADPEQRIYDFLGADPERLNHFVETFSPLVTDLESANYRSGGTDIAKCGNDILAGNFTGNYEFVDVVRFQTQSDIPYYTLKLNTIFARKRLLESGSSNWTVAILVPTKKLMRSVSYYLKIRQPRLPEVNHTAFFDMEAVILSAEIIAYLLQINGNIYGLKDLVEMVSKFYQGKGGDSPTKKDIGIAERLLKSFDSLQSSSGKRKEPKRENIILPISRTAYACNQIALSGNPNLDWVTIRDLLDESDSEYLRAVGAEARNLQLLDRGTILREALSRNWREAGAYSNALNIVRNAFIQEHFSATTRKDIGVIVMNMHKAKGKQFDEVIIFEGWPTYQRRVMVSNTDRIVYKNSLSSDLSQSKQLLRVAITRARSRVTILTPNEQPCILLQKLNLDGRHTAP